MRIAAIETRRYRYPLDPPFSAAWDPEPRTHQDATIVVVRSNDGVEGYASGERPARPRAPRGAARRARSDARRHRPRNPRDRRLPSRTRLDARGRRLGSRRASARSTPLASARRPRGSDRRLRLERRARGASTSACAALWHCATRAYARSSSASTRRDWRVDLPVIEAVREDSRLRPAADGRRQPGLAHAGRSHSALGP